MLTFEVIINLTLKIEIINFEMKLKIEFSFVLGDVAQAFMLYVKKFRLISFAFAV